MPTGSHTCTGTPTPEATTTSPISRDLSHASHVKQLSNQGARNRRWGWPVLLLPALLPLLLLALAPAFRWHAQAGHVTAGALPGEIGCRPGLHVTVEGPKREWDLCIARWHWFVVVRR